MVAAAGCVAKKPYRLAWESAHLDGLFGSGVRSSLKAASPVFGGEDPSDRSGLLYVGTRQGALMALKVSNGQSVWRLQHDSAFEAPGVLDRDVLYIGDMDGRLIAVDRWQGKVLWKYDGEYEILAPPTLQGDRVIFANNANTVIALNRKDGRFIWRYREDPPIGVTMRGISQPSLSTDGKQVYVGFTKGAIVALDGMTGEVKWRRLLTTQERYEDVDASPLVMEDKIIVSSVSGPLAAYSMNGRLLWVNDKVRTQVSPVSVGNRLFVATMDATALEINVETGETVWETHVFKPSEGKSIVPSVPIVHANDLIVGWSQGQVSVLEQNGGKILWRYRLGKAVTGALLALDNGFVAMSDKQALFRFVAR